MVPELIIVGLFVAMFAVPIVAYLKSYVRVEAGKALVVNKLNVVQVYFSSGLVLPLIHRGELIDISIKRLSIDRRGKDGLICKDRIRADVQVQFFVRVRSTSEDVMRVAQLMGCERAGDPTVVEELFLGKFSEALESVAAQLEFGQLYTQREAFRDELISVIGQDLNGFVLEDVVIDYLEQTPIDQLDPNNILDAEGIKKIVEITEARKMERAELESRARQQRLKLDALVAELEHRKADVLGRFQRDMGRELSEADLRARIAELLVEQFGPQVTASGAKALVDAASPS